MGASVLDIFVLVLVVFVVVALSVVVFAVVVFDKAPINLVRDNVFNRKSQLHTVYKFYSHPHNN